MEFQFQRFLSMYIRFGSPPTKRPDTLKENSINSFQRFQLPRNFTWTTADSKEHMRCRLSRTINVERELFLNNVHNGAIERGLIQMSRPPTVQIWLSDLA